MIVSNLSPYVRVSLPALLCFCLFTGLSKPQSPKGGGHGPGAGDTAITVTSPSPSPSAVVDFTIKPTLVWEFRTAAPIFASPVVANGMVYIGGLDSILHALTLRDGREIWNFRTNGPIRSDAVITAGRLFLNGGDGNVYALDPESGRLLWKFKTKGEQKYDFADYFHSTPVVLNDTLYFGSGDGNVYALGAGNGAMIWSYTTGNIVHTTPAVANGRVFIGSFDGHLYALRTADGSLMWKFKTVGHRYFPAGEVQGSPVAYDNLVIFGARDYNVYALDQEKGYCHWNKAFTRGWGLNNNIHDSVLYIGSADERRLIAAVAETGREFWNKEMEFLVFGNNAYSETMLCLGTTIGKLHGINLTTGEKVWSYETGSYLQNRSKYFKPDDTYRDDIYSIIRSNEQFLEVEIELGGIFSTPCISGHRILFSSTNGSIFCLE